MTLFSEKCLFPLDACMVSCPTSSKNLGQTLMCTGGTFTVVDILARLTVGHDDAHN